LLGRFLLLDYYQGGRVDNVDYPSWARGCNCGQFGQPKNKLSTMSTNTKDSGKRKRARAEKLGNCGQYGQCGQPVLNRWFITLAAVDI
jgi:hypothetical protein